MTQTLLTPEREKDIATLKSKIGLYRDGKIDEDRFKLFRLTRGVYGQRQPDVQMVRIKLPYGKVKAEQLRTMARVADEYTHGNLHITTRQNIQLHHVPLEDSVAIWTELEKVGVTTLESCGNTVRGITASPFAGIDPKEPFDVTPYAHAVFKYFLKNPICADMGRKVKIAFSASAEDAAFTYIHDFGFIPKIKDGKRGFQVLIGGGLGAQSFMAQLAYDFLEEDKVIPFIAAGLRVFDRYGERERRNKARMKFLIEPNKGVGVDGFMELVANEYPSLPHKTFKIDVDEEPVWIKEYSGKIEEVSDQEAFEEWKRINVVEQKQKGFYAVKVRVPLGDIKSDKARAIADIMDAYAADDIRLTINQGFILKFVKADYLTNIYNALLAIDLAKPGFDTLSDVTACPGTDTCNLGVTNSTALATVLEEVIRDEYPQLIDERLIKIKISGCMNACGQHMVANIGFSGSSIKHEGKIAPAMQVVIGGGVDPDGRGYIAEKVIKIPTKRIPQTLRDLLEDYEANSEETEYFNEYFRRQGKIYFYDLLKHNADLSAATDDIFQDWGHIEDFVPEIGVGECAGVVLDLVGTILLDAQERYDWAKESIEGEKYANAIYYGYNALVIGAKGLLLSNDVTCNTHKGIIDSFQSEIVEKGTLSLPVSFPELVGQMSKNEPSREFAEYYVGIAGDFLEKIKELRDGQQGLVLEKEVVSDFYKA